MRNLLNWIKPTHQFTWLLLVFVISLVCVLVVKTVFTRGQFAWEKGREFSTSSHQRLNVEHPNDEFFKQWLIGLTDGDGSFSIANQNGKWSLAFKIGQSIYNLRALYYIKSQLGYGSINVEKATRMANFRIRDRKVLINVIFPIFDKFPLLT